MAELHNPRIARFTATAHWGLAGSNDASWDGRSDDGDKVSKGVYLCVVETPAQRETLKVGVLH